VNSGGVKVDPVEVERVLLSLPSVKECRVQAGRDGRGLEVLTSMIVMRSGHACSRRDVIEHCRKHLAEYKIPRVIEFLDTIPSDLSGKSPVEWLSK
jgi:acyl-CoA synthetase (AMP-forming)/AMP-acid ligase II